MTDDPAPSRTSAAVPIKRGAPFELPLFPLGHVLFPGGVLQLKVFEARYLDLIGRCLREASPFGVVCLKQGDEVRRPGQADVARFEPLGVLAQIDDVDVEQAGILRVRAHGTQRFMLTEPRQQSDGLWLADATLLEDDVRALPEPALKATVEALANAVATLRAQGARPFAEPHRYDDAGWVANRWCELLPITHAARQQLMALADPMVRLKLVDDFLRSRGVVGDGPAGGGAVH